jgi:hypothetical protein
MPRRADPLAPFVWREPTPTERACRRLLDLWHDERPVLCPRFAAAPAWPEGYHRYIAAALDRLEAAIAEVRAAIREEEA